MLPVSLVLVAYSHTGFLAYAALLLMMEAVFYRDRRRALRAGIAIAVACVASMPLLWEIVRYPSYFDLSNAFFTRTTVDP